MKVQKKRSVGIANWFYFFIFSGPRSRPFLQELPNCTSLPCVPCYPQSLIFFYLIASQSLWDICISRTLQMTVPSPVTYSGWRGRDHPEEQWGVSHQNLLGFSQAIPCCQNTLPPPPPARPGRTRPAPCPASEDERPPFLCSHWLTWHIWWQEQKLLIRENAVMRYFFFLFVLLDKSIISSLSSQVSRSSTSLFLPLPSRPLPTRDPHTPGLGHCTPAQRPSGSSSRALGPSSKWAAAMRVGVCSFCCFVFSANTRTEREARINSQTDTKQRDRETAV